MFTYTELKKSVEERKEPYLSYYRNFIALFEEMYDITELKAMYIRNLVNEEEKETLFFFSGKIVTVTKEDLHFRFKENRGIVISKEYLVSKDSGRKSEIIIRFDNKEILTLNNIKDSNPHWAEEYAESIKEIYKCI